MAWLLVGSIPGVLLGSQMSIRIPERSLRFAFAFVLVLSGIKLVGVPHAGVVIVVALAAGAVALSVYAVRQLFIRQVALASDWTTNLESAGLAPRPLDGSPPRVARRDHRRVRGH
jgi:uncharacterized membrane protein YqgA involved in biofilm formation